LSELAAHYTNDENARGEIVLLIDRNVIGEAVAPNQSVVALVDRYEQEGLDHRAALKKAARELGLSRAEAYRKLIAERGAS
jgi:16S rRNA (cytidine1402-2'-O)-methyltransferase